MIAPNTICFSPFALLSVSSAVSFAEYKNSETISTAIPFPSKITEEVSLPKS